jgi:hypothetical protein
MRRRRVRRNPDENFIFRAAHPPGLAAWHDITTCKRFHWELLSADNEAGTRP